MASQYSGGSVQIHTELINARKNVPVIWLEWYWSSVHVSQVHTRKRSSDVCVNKEIMVTWQSSFPSKRMLMSGHYN